MIYLGSVLLLALVALIAGRRRGALLIVLVALLSNLASITIYYLAPELSDVALAVSARELTVYTFFVLTFLLVRRLRWPVGTLIDRVYLGLLVFFVVNIIGSIPRNGVTSLLMGRELIFPLATYFLFRFLNLDERAIRSLMRLIVSIAVVVGLVAVVEQIYVNLINPNLWHEWRISGYLAQKYGSFDDPFPLSWVNYLPGFLGLPHGMRSIGLMLDPLATGHFLACSLPIAYYWYRGWQRYFFLSIVFLGVICTFSKASMLISFVFLGSQAFRVKHWLVRYGLLAFVASCILAIGGLLLSTDDDAFTHFGSFRAGTEALFNHPLGKGVGSTGYFNMLVTGEGTASTIDTTYSVYAYQMGWPGLLALMCLVLLPTSILFTHLYWLRSRGLFVSSCVSRMLMTVLPLFLSYSILAFASAASFTAVPVFTPMLLLGTYGTLWVRLRTATRQPARSMLASLQP